MTFISSLQRRRMSSAVVPLGVIHTVGGRQTLDRASLRAAVFAGVDRLLCPLVELMFSPGGSVGVSRAQSCPRQLTDALKRPAAVFAIKVSIVHISCIDRLRFIHPAKHDASTRTLFERAREHRCERQKASADDQKHAVLVLKC